MKPQYAKYTIHLGIVGDVDPNTSWSLKQPLTVVNDDTGAEFAGHTRVLYAETTDEMMVKLAVIAAGQLADMKAQLDQSGLQDDAERDRLIQTYLRV